MESFSYEPTADEIEQEGQYWKHEEMRHEAAEWAVRQAEAGWDFATWPLVDLVDELDTVRTLTPDQAGIIEELEVEITRRTENAA